MKNRNRKRKMEMKKLRKRIKKEKRDKRGSLMLKIVLTRIKGKIHTRRIRRAQKNWESSTKQKTLVSDSLFGIFLWLMMYRIIRAFILLSFLKLAISMATKAGALARELKSIKSDLCFMQERCNLLEEENRRLRDGIAKGIRQEEDDLVPFPFIHSRLKNGKTKKSHPLLLHLQTEFERHKDE